MEEKRTSAEAKKDFLRLFKELCYSRTSWQVWADLMSVFAISIANTVDHSEPKWERREKEYQKCILNLGGHEKPTELLLCIVDALTRNPEQDFLGTIFMELNLGNHWRGQFFTPYSVCKCMSEINCQDVIRAVNDKGYASVNDCACGAGATLIAMANSLKLRNVNYQTQVLFVGQDIDRIAGLMGYIQLSLLGCPGYIVIADSLTNPLLGASVLMPAEKDGQEFWYTPMFFRDCWTLRRFGEMAMKKLAG